MGLVTLGQSLWPGLTVDRESDPLLQRFVHDVDVVDTTGDDGAVVFR